MPKYWFVLGLLVATVGVGVLPMSWGMDSAADNHQQTARINNYGDHVHNQCRFTRYPKLCIETLLGHGNAHDILYALVEKTRDETTKLSTAAHLPNYQLAENLTSQHPHHVAIGYCVEVMNMSLKRLNQSLIALKNSRIKSKLDIQTWLSGVLTFQQACKDSVEGSTSSSSSWSLLVDQISKRMDYLSRLASNSLALVNRITRTSPNEKTKLKITKSGGRRLFSYVASETSEFDQAGSPLPFHYPGWLSHKDRKILLQSSTGSGAITANAVVAKDGTGNFRTVSEAIMAATGGRFVIYVKTGVYKEKIHTNKDGIILIGDGKYSTIITGGDSVAAGSSLADTATFAINGNGFIARDIGFQNTAGPGGRQAVALYIASDRSVLYRCSIAGYQDSLYALAFRQFYRECDIYGTIDFIFGNAAAVFQSCNLVLRGPRSSGFSVILANGRTDPGQNTGFSVQSSRIVPSADYTAGTKSYLGRPWKQYSRSVVMQSSIDVIIAARGWVEWSDGFALKTLYFAEYQNMGPGAGTSQRVTWPGFHLISMADAQQFTVAKFIGGNSWLPSTGVTFVSGL
ncbi:hypothetical protein NE237_026959 [Protea cynaroides]|uniref:Pectinesterase n=1 Tax=Protea cynaroides TaxID=273540 RepID=A0A9Q0GQB1_9MAGN|nr:hypothetical protein NE237_026959 [Protea cynaroides]